MNLIKALIPRSILKIIRPIYHGLIAQLATTYFGNPSKTLFVIGITGTAGKSTTAMMLAKILNSVGQRTGYITTAGSDVGQGFITNSQGMSMPGGWVLQKKLKTMLENSCKFGIVECTSEGLAQNRHLGILFRAGIFTNLSPAHLDSHGGFDNYRQAKSKLFQILSKYSESMSVINLDDPNSNYFLAFPVKKKIGISTREDREIELSAKNLEVLHARNIEVTNHIAFNINNIPFSLKLFGSFNVSNALLAIATAKSLGVSIEKSSQALATINSLEGRMEVFKSQVGAIIIVDYAPEPIALEASLRSISMIPHNKLIHVFGVTGGHRDVEKRFLFGKLSAKFADTIIITNDDVYDSDPQQIANNIKSGIEQQTNKQVSVVKEILEREQAITEAVRIANHDDIVLITGKGSEQFLVLPNNQRISWDDRELVKKLIR